MKNKNLIIYSVLSLVILFLLSTSGYLLKANISLKERIYNLEKENEFKPLEENFFPNIMKDYSQQINVFLEENSEYALNVFDDNIKYCGTEREIARSYFKGFVEPLADATLRAKTASFKTTVIRARLSVMDCIDDKGFVNVPVSGELVCQQNKEEFWPEFDDERAVWGGCEFEIDKSKGTFKYCANFGEIKAVCTQDGCEF